MRPWLPCQQPGEAGWWLRGASRVLFPLFCPNCHLTSRKQHDKHSDSTQEAAALRDFSARTLLSEPIQLLSSYTTVPSFSGWHQSPHQQPQKLLWRSEGPPLELAALLVILPFHQGSTPEYLSVPRQGRTVPTSPLLPLLF